MKEGTSSKQSQMTAFVALVCLTALEFTARCVAALWTDLTHWLEKLVKSFRILSITTILFEKIVQNKTFLKLNGIL